MPRKKKPLYDKYSMERNVTAIFDPDNEEEIESIKHER